MQKSSGTLKFVLASLAVLVVLGGALYVGIAYMQNRAGNPPTLGNSPTQNNGTGIANGSGGGAQNGNQRSTGLGSVTGTIEEVNSQSIKVKATDGTSKTYTITANTSIADAKAQSFGNASSGQLSASNLTVGETVLVTPDQQNSTQAIGILVNP